MNDDPNDDNITDALHIPLEIWSHIISFLPLRDKITMTQLSHTYRDAALRQITNIDTAYVHTVTEITKISHHVTKITILDLIYPTSLIQLTPYTYLRALTINSDIEFAPDNLQLFGHLTYLNINRPKYESQHPSWARIRDHDLIQLTNLQQLHINTILGGVIGIYMNYLTKLRSITVNIGIICYLKHLTNLVDIEVHHHKKLEYSRYKHSHLSNVTRLYISGCCNIEPAIFTHITNLRSLTFDNYMGIVNQINISHITSLQYLSISSMDIVDIDLCSLTNLTHLTLLSAQSCITMVNQLTKLRSLEVDISLATYVASISPVLLTQIKKLYLLGAYRNDRLSKECIRILTDGGVEVEISDGSQSVVFYMLDGCLHKEKYKQRHKLFDPRERLLSRV